MHCQMYIDFIGFYKNNFYSRYDMLLLFALSFVMVFGSGGFIPSSFLPGFIRSLQHLIPTTGWIEVMGDLFTGRIRLPGLLQTLVWGAACILVTWTVESLRQNRRIGS